MKDLMKHIAMVVVFLACAVGAYMAVQAYCGSGKEEVKVQFLNFGGTYEDGDRGSVHTNSYDRGYKAGYEAGLKEASKN